MRSKHIFAYLTKKKTPLIGIKSTDIYVYDKDKMIKTSDES